MILYYWLIWILPLIQHPIWGLQIGPLTVVEYLGIACLLYSVVHVFVREKIPHFFASREVRLFMILYCLAILSFLIGSKGLAADHSAFIVYTSSLFLVLITIAVVDSLDRLRLTVFALIGSYAFASLYVIREWQVNRAMGIFTRPGWVVLDSNYFATAAIYAMALAICLLQGKRAWWEKAYCLGCLLVIIVATTLCASRGGFLGLMAACILIVWRTQNRVRNLLLVTVLVLPLSLILPISPLHRFIDQKDADLGSTQAHLDAWNAGFEMIEAHPLLGVGLGNFKPMMPRYVPAGTNTDTLAHNMFIEVAAELGLPALFIFVAIYYSCFRTLGKLSRDLALPDLFREAAAGLQAGILGVALAGCFVSAEYQKTTWMGFALAVCLVPLAQSLKAKAPEQVTLRTLGERSAEAVPVAQFHS
jgi:O-antigen ligase